MDIHIDIFIYLNNTNIFIYKVYKVIYHNKEKRKRKKK